MEMPGLNLDFIEKAATAIKRGDRGIVALILKEENVPETNPVTCQSNDDILKTLSDANKQQIKFALIGYNNMPKRVVAYVLKDDAEDYSEAFKYFKTCKVNYLAVPTVETDGKKDDVVSFVKKERESGNKIKAVLPNVKADTEGIINYTTKSVYIEEKEYTTEEYCSRIAGVLAGTSLKSSATYASLTELTDCTRLEKAERNTAVNNGEFIVWWDGEKVKTGRAINSLQTMTEEKNKQYKKIKIIDAIDMIDDDLHKSIEDSYIGKYANSYDNKCLLISAIGTYLQQLKSDGVLSEYSIAIDIDATRTYLKGLGKKVLVNGIEKDVNELTDDEVKRADTDANVYLKGAIKVLDAIEDVYLPIYM